MQNEMPYFSIEYVCVSLFLHIFFILKDLPIVKLKSTCFLVAWDVCVRHALLRFVFIIEENRPHRLLHGKRNRYRL